MDPVVYPRLTAMAAGLLLMFLAFLLPGNQPSWKGVLLRDPFMLSLTGYVLLTGAGLLHAVNPVEGLTDLFRNILFLFYVLAAISVFSRWQGARAFVLKCLVISLFLSVVAGTYQFFTLRLPLSDPDVLYEVSGLMAHKNQYSISLFLHLPFLLLAARYLAGPWRTAAWTSVALGLAMIAVLQTRAVWAAILIGLLVLVLTVLFTERKSHVFRDELKGLKKPLIGAVVAGCAVLAAVFLFPDSFPFNKVHARFASVLDPAYASNLWRMQIWTATRQLFADHLWLGVGAGNWKIEVYPYYSEFLPSVFKHWRNPHNDYLLVGSEKGVAGLALYAMIYLSLIWSGVRNMLHPKERGQALDNAMLVSGVTGFMVVSFFSFPSERIYPLIYIGLMVAFMSPGTARPGTEGTACGRSRYALMLLMIIALLVSVFGARSVINEVHVAKADAAFLAGDWKGLERHAKRVRTSLAPFEPRYSFPVINYHGMAYFLSEKEMQKALACFQKAHRQHPTHIRVLNNIGTVYAQLGEYGPAIRHFQNALELFPHFENGLINLAKAHYMKQDFVMAYRALLACDPRSPNQEIRVLRARIEQELERGDSAGKDQDTPGPQ